MLTAADRLLAALADLGARRLTEDDVPAVLALCAGNPLFYRYHEPTSAEDVRDDLTALPPGKEMSDKLYAGFFSGGALTAVLDAVLDYPAPGMAFLGFFMLDSSRQDRGEGSGLLGKILAALRALGYCSVRLAVDDGNPQSAAFWTKNGFRFTGERFSHSPCDYLPMERALP